MHDARGRAAQSDVVFEMMCAQGQLRCRQWLLRCRQTCTERTSRGYVIGVLVKGCGPILVSLAQVTQFVNMRKIHKMNALSLII